MPVLRLKHKIIIYCTVISLFTKISLITIYGHYIRRLTHPGIRGECH